MNSEVVNILDTLQYGRQLKVLYIITLLPRITQKQFIQHLLHTQIGTLCSHLRRFITSDTEKLNRNSGFRLKLNCYTSAYYMFHGIVYVFKYKTDELLDDLCTLLKDGFQKMYRGPSMSSSLDEDRLLLEELLYGKETGSHLGESSTTDSSTDTDLLSLLRTSSNVVEDVRAITIDEEAVEVPDWNRPSELNMGFLAEFCGGDEEAMERLQISWLQEPSARKSIPPVSIMEVDEPVVPNVPPVSFMEVDEPPVMRAATSINIREADEQVVPALLDSHIQQLIDLSFDRQSTLPPQQKQKTRDSDGANESLVIPAHIIKARMKGPTWKRTMTDIVALQRQSPQLDFLDLLNLLPDMAHFTEFTDTELQGIGDEALLNVEEDTSAPLSLAARVYRYEQEHRSQLSSAGLEDLRQTVYEADMLLATMLSVELEAAHTPPPQQSAQQMTMLSTDVQPMHIESELTMAMEESAVAPLPPAEPQKLVEELQRTDDTTVLQEQPQQVQRIDDIAMQQEQPQQVKRTDDTAMQLEQPQQEQLQQQKQIQQEQIQQEQIQQEQIQQEQIQQEQIQQEQIQQEVQIQQERVTRRRNIDNERYEGLDPPVRRRRRPARKRQRPTVHEESGAAVPPESLLRPSIDAAAAPDSLQRSSIGAAAAPGSLPRSSIGAAALEPLPRPSIGATPELPVQEEGSIQKQGVKWIASRMWTEDLLLDHLKILWQQHDNVITFTMVCDRSHDRLEAAQIFMLLLNMAKKRLLQLDQTLAFSPDHIFILPVKGF